MPSNSPLLKSEMNIACIRNKLQKLNGKHIHTKYIVLVCTSIKNFMY